MHNEGARMVNQCRSDTDSKLYCILAWLTVRQTSKSDA